METSADCRFGFSAILASNTPKSWYLKCYDIQSVDDSERLDCPKKVLGSQRFMHVLLKPSIVPRIRAIVAFVSR
jgi:hypothetical protein